MRWPHVIVAAALLAGACVADAAPHDAGSEPVTPAPSPSSPDTTPNTDTSFATAPPVPVRIEVLGDHAVNVFDQLAQLPNFGFRVFATGSDHLRPEANLTELFPSLEVRELTLSWGVDSTALLIVAEGDSPSVSQASAVLTETAGWVGSGETWLAAVYAGGLAAGFERRGLVDVIGWLMDPQMSCAVSERACPLGDEAGFPPPPPNLVVNGATNTVVPFEIREIQDAEDIHAPLDQLTWSVDDSYYTGWSLGDAIEVLRAQPGGVATTLGSAAFVSKPGLDGGPGSVELRPCCDSPNTAEWPLPRGFEVEGIVAAGNEPDLLLMTGTREGGEPAAIAIPMDIAGLFQATYAVPANFDPEALVDLTPAGEAWTIPRRTRLGRDVQVVAERPDGWYLIEDALGDPVDVLRSNHPILSHSSDAGNQNVALVVDAPDGPSLWWVHNGEAVEIESEATSISWFGHHLTAVLTG